MPSESDGNDDNRVTTAGRDRNQAPAAAGAPWSRGVVEAEQRVLDLLEREPAIAALIDRFGPYRWELQPPFRALTSSIVSQSVSGASADAVFARLEAATGITPDGVLASDREVLRNTGLSWSKVDAIQRVASFTREGHLDHVSALDDDGVARRLTELKGIGPWTAEMFLLFCLGRLDVWPVGDLTIRQQVERIYGVEGRSAVREIGERFRPYRSAVVWYLWRVNAAPGDAGGP